MRHRRYSFRECIGHLHSIHILQCTRRPPPGSPLTRPTSTTRHCAARSRIQAHCPHDPNVLTGLHSPAHPHLHAPSVGKRDTSNMPESMSTCVAVLAVTLHDERLLCSRIHSRIHDTVSAESSAGSLLCCPPFRSTSSWTLTHSLRVYRGPHSIHGT